MAKQFKKRTFVDLGHHTVLGIMHHIPAVFMPEVMTEVTRRLLHPRRLYHPCQGMLSHQDFNILRSSSSVCAEVDITSRRAWLAA
eukprot:3985757-Amphidinium_carterae.1